MFARADLIACTASVALAAFAGPAAAGPVLDRIRDQGIVVAAADATWPPFSWRDPIGEFHGFDVDVTREIADRLGARAEFVTPTWEEQVAGDWNGAWDVAVTSMTPTADRAVRLAFPAIYFYGQAAVAVPVDRADVLDPADLSGRRIGVVEDTIYAAYLRREEVGFDLTGVAYRIDNPEIVEFEDTAAPYRLVEQGDVVDAVIDDLIAIKAQIAQGRPIRIVGAPLFSAPSAVAIERGDPELAAELARIVTDMHADGTLRELSIKWFDVDASRAVN